MFQGRRATRTRDMFLLSGWLFADLLLALMMIFLVSVNGDSRPQCGGGTATPGTPTASARASNVFSLASAGNKPGSATSTPTGGNQGGTPYFPTPTPCPGSPTPTASPTSTPTPQPTPLPCGLNLQDSVDTSKDPVPITVSDPNGLLNDKLSAQQDFEDQVMARFASHSQEIAGLVEVYGGGKIPAAGQNFAAHAITALKQLGNRQPPFIFDQKHAYFQSLWDGSIASNQVTLFVIFYYQSDTGSCVNL